MLVLKKVFAFVVSLCLLSIQVSPAYASYFSSSKDTVNVAFIGIDFTDVEQDQQLSIEGRVSTLIEQVPSFYYVPEKEIQNRLDPSLVSDLKENLRKEDFRKVAELLNVDYLFAGNIENRSNNQETSALVGKMARYDVATDNLYTLNIERFFKNFNEEITRIDNQLVQSIVPEQEESFLKRYLPGFLIVAATAVAVTILIGGTKGQSSGDGGPTPPFSGN